MTKFTLFFSCLILIGCSSSKISLEKKYYDTGELKFEIHKLKNQYHGITNEYLKNGELRYQWNYKLDKLDGETTEYHPDGTKSIWIYSSDSLKQRNTYTKHNVLFQTFNYLNDLAHGNVHQFYDTGEIEVIWIYDKNVVISGKSYYKTGELKIDFNYDNGKSEGISTEYYQSGEIKLEWLYINGNLNGITKEYFKSGKIKCEWNYNNGVLDGKSISYDSQSKILNYIYYDNGKFIIEVKPY